MITRPKRRFHYLVMAHLLAGSLAASAAHYRVWQDKRGQHLQVTFEAGDNLEKVARDLAHRAGKTLKDEEMISLMFQIADENRILITTDPAPGTELVIGNAQYWVTPLFKDLSSGRIMASSRIEIPGSRPVEADYVRSRGKEQWAKALGWAHLEPRRIILNMDRLVRRYGDKGRDVLRKSSEAVLCHEYIHIMTMDIIRSKGFKDRLAKLTQGRKASRESIADEVAAFLGHMYCSEDPRDRFDEFFVRTFSKDIPAFDVFQATSEIIRAKLEAKYGSIYLMGQIPRDRQREDIKIMFREIFGMDIPDRKYFVIPEQAF